MNRRIIRKGVLALAGSAKKAKKASKRPPKFLWLVIYEGFDEVDAFKRRKDADSHKRQVRNMMKCRIHVAKYVRA